MRIMVVDDMSSMRMQVKKILEDLGFEPNDILSMPDGHKAYNKIMEVNKIPGQQVKLCISDWNMAPVDGLQLLKLIRKEESIRELPFIMLTAEQNQTNIISAIQAGADEYIIKPFNSDTLKKKLENVANKKLQEVNKEFTRYFARDESDKGLDNITDEKAGKLMKFFGSKYANIIPIAPWSSLGPMSLGQMYMRFKRYAEAEKQFRKAVSIDFAFAKAHDELSKALKAQNKIADSSKALEVALAVKPNSPELRQRLGEAYLREGNYSKAIVMLQESLVGLEQKGDNKKTAQNMGALGEAKMSKGEAQRDVALLKEGAKDLEGAVEADPDLISAQYNLMAAYRKTGQKDKALKVFDSIKTMEPKDAEGWLALGRAFLEKEEKPKALFAFKNAGNLTQRKYGTFSDIAYALYSSKCFKEVAEFNSQAKEENPSDKQAYNLAGLIHRSMGNLKPAIENYEQAIKLDPEDAGLTFNLGFAYFKNEQKDKGKEYLNKAAEMAPELQGRVADILDG